MRLINPGLVFNGSLSDLNLDAIDGIVFHHMAHETAGIETIHGWHRNNGWAGFGYNFWGDKQGRGYEGRGWKQGAHARGHNSTKIGVGLQGDFERNNSMTDAQVTFAIEIVKYIFNKLGRKVPIYVHGDVGVTACAGRHFRMDEIKRGLKEGTKPNNRRYPKDMILRNGSSGANVRQLQEDLMNLGYSLPRWGADSEFGDETEAAVRQLQRDYNLQVDGIAGPQTFGKIEALLAAESDFYRVQVGAFSSKRNAEAMEKQLKEAGFDTYLVKN